MGTKIMIVDDSSIVRQQVSQALMEAGFHVVEAVDGQDAAEKIAEHGSVSLLLCDVNMPRMNGIELLTKLAGPGNSPPFPVLMLTTDGQPELIARAKGLGAKGWMVKPVRPAILVATVKKLTQ
jgi:two-component system, chemotaxis family, chemotaxis protein CheY